MAAPPKSVSCTVTFKGSVTPKGTKFLKSNPISMDFSATMDLSGSDAGNVKAVQSAFESEMESRIKSQLDFLNKWLSERDDVIDDMVKRFETLKKEGFPEDAGKAAQRVKTLKELGELAVKIEKFPDEYATIVQNWAQNCRDQQGKISIQLAVKKARITTFEDKSWRVRAGQIVKGVLIVAAIAASVAAIVVSAGATAPLFIGLAAAGATVAGVSNLTNLTKNIVDNANMEKRILANAQKDVEAIAAAFSGAKDKNAALFKHLQELGNLMKKREGDIAKLQNDLLPAKAAIAGYSRDIGKLAGDASLNSSEISSKVKAAADVAAKIKDTEGKIAGLKAENAKGEELLKTLSALNVEIDKISGNTPNTVLGNLKERFSKIEGWTDLGNSVGGIVNSASGIHS